MKKEVCDDDGVDIWVIRNTPSSVFANKKNFLGKWTETAITMELDRVFYTLTMAAHVLLYYTRFHLKKNRF